jgi:hypothetical protein
MANAFIPVTPGVGFNLQTYRNVIGGSSVDSEAVTLTNSSGIEEGTASNPVIVALAAGSFTIGKVDIFGNAGAILDSAVGTPNGQALTIQGNASGVPVPVTISGGASGNPAAGPTGSPVPADADYVGFNSSSNPTVDGANADDGFTTGNYGVITTGSVTTSHANDFCVFAVMVGTTSPNTIVDGAGWITDYLPATVDVTNLIFAHQIPSSAGSITGTATKSDGNGWGAMLACFTPSGGVPAILQSAISNLVAYPPSSASISQALTNPVQANSTIVISFVVNNTGGAISSLTFTDSQSNVYTVAIEHSFQPGGSAAFVGCAYAKVSAAGSLTVTLNTNFSTNNSDISFIAYEVQNLAGGSNLVGVSATTPLPVTLPSGTIAALTPPSAAAIGAAVAADLLIGTQSASASVPVALPTGTITTLTPPTAAAIAAAIVANPPTTFNGVVTNAGTFAVQVTNFPATQPVSGTVAVTQSTSPWIVAGGGTAGSPGTAVLTIQGISGGTAVPISGTITATIATPTDWGTAPATSVLVPAVNAEMFVGQNAVSATAPVPVSATAAANTSGNPIFVSAAITSTNISTNLAQWAGTALGAPANFGTTPGAVIAGSVNASLFIGTTVAVAASAGVQKVGISGATGTTLDSAAGTPNSQAITIQGNASGVAVPVSLTSTTITGTVSVTQGTSPWIVAGGGTAGSAASGVITVQGIASMTPVQVSQATAANLNATVVGTGTFAVQATIGAGSATIGKVDILGNAGATLDSAAGTPNSQAITIQGNASGVAVPVSGTITTTPPSNASTNITQWASTALGVPTNFGTTPGAVIAASVNASLFLGTTSVPATVLTAASTAPVATQPSLNVSITPNQPTAMFSGTVPGTAPANTILTGEIYNSSAPAPTAGQTLPLQSDAYGSMFVKPYRRSQTVAQATTIASSSASTTVLAAQAAGVFADISSFVVTVTAASVTAISFTVTLSDGTNSYVFDMDTGTVAASSGPLIISFNPPLAATAAATAWTVTLSVATVTVHITVAAVLQKAS